MRNLPFLFLFIALIVGCSRKEKTPGPVFQDYLLPQNRPSLHLKRFSEPRVAVVAMDTNQKGGFDAVHYKALQDFPISVRNKFSAYEGLGYGETMVYLSLFERRPDPAIAGNLLLKFEVLWHREVIDVPLVSWNQEDDLDLISTGTWLVKLTRNGLVEK